MKLPQRRRSQAHLPWGPATDQKPRVLLECEPSSTPSVAASVLEDSGYVVRVCHGPEETCDLLDRGACALVDGADVVVNMLRDQHNQMEVIESTLGMRRPPPLVAEITRPVTQSLERSDPQSEILDPSRVTVVTTPMRRAELLDAVETALKKKDQPSPIWGDGV